MSSSQQPGEPLSPEAALTCREAALLLGVSRSRVSQLLAEGLLTGPKQPANRRASPNAPRVWRESVDQRLRHRTHGAAEVSHDPDIRDARALRDDVIRLKSALDVSLDQIAAQRTQTSRVTHLLAQAVEALEAEQKSSQALDDVARALSSVVTTHVFPDTLTGLSGAP